MHGFSQCISGHRWKCKWIVCHISRHGCVIMHVDGGGGHEMASIDALIGESLQCNDHLPSHDGDAVELYVGSS
jgi:hypothetical protein